MPFCLSIFSGLFFIATPAFIGLRRADFAALDLNLNLTNDQLFIAELSVCIAYAILIGITLYQCANTRYSKSMENYIKFSNNNNTNKRTSGTACLYFAGAGILFSTLNIYILPRLTNALSTNIWSLRTGLLTIIGSGLLLSPILLQDTIKGTRNKVIVLLLAYLFIASGITLHILPNISLIKSEKIINIMHQANFYAAATCGVALLLLIITFLVLNYNSKSRLNKFNTNDDAPDIQEDTKNNAHNVSDQKVMHHEKKNHNPVNYPFPNNSPLNMIANLPPPPNSPLILAEDDNSMVIKYKQTSDNGNDSYLLNEKNEPKLKLNVSDQKAGYYHEKPLSFFDSDANPDLATPSPSIKKIVFYV